jgi:hypothetical protein
MPMPARKITPRSPRAALAASAARNAGKPAQPDKPELPGQAAKPVKAGKAGKPPKLHRKPVRDSFTMPEADFALIATLKARALAAKRETKKSELLRAGLHALAALDTRALVVALGQLDPVKVGRPKREP